ncbi:MAG: SDR family oxidoreductase [Nocardiopsaceae bacterium]|nr:SDR family oxidoreductase [Nocardiopsaceae bacterium]
MRIAVTGARGLLGSEVARRLAADGHAVTGWSSGRHGGYRHADVRRQEDIDLALDSDRPDAVVHCAANPNIASCEADPAAARELNALAVQKLVGAAVAREIRVVHVSTDYVFSGGKDGGYDEDDPSDPLQVYGRTKAEAETYCADAEGVLVVRMPLLFGVSRVVPKATFPEQVIRQLRVGKEVEADAVEVRQPTYTTDIAAVIARLVEGKATGVVHVAAQQGITKFDWAVGLAGKAGLDASPIRATQPRPDSNRPLRSFLLDHRLRDLGIPSPRPVSASADAFLSEAGLL